MASIQEEVQSLKNKGNTCVREGKFEEAVLTYTQAIKLDPKNYSLYSNRSLAFLKISQFYHAHEDALETIRLKPDWPKGYFRKGEVEAAAYQYSDALKSYSLASALLPNDSTIEEAIRRTNTEMQKERKANEQVPWVGAGIGIIIGVAVVLADQLLTEKPSIKHPILMALLTVAIALIGFGMGKGIRYYVSCQRKGLMDPPLDLFEELSDENGEVPMTENGERKSSSSHQRYTKAQARHRLKKGKS